MGIEPVWRAAAGSREAGSREPASALWWPRPAGTVAGTGGWPVPAGLSVGRPKLCAETEGCRDPEAAGRVGGPIWSTTTSSAEPPRVRKQKISMTHLAREPRWRLGCTVRRRCTAGLWGESANIGLRTAARGLRLRSRLSVMWSVENVRREGRDTGRHQRVRGREREGCGDMRVYGEPLGWDMCALLTIDGGRTSAPIEREAPRSRSPDKGGGEGQRGEGGGVGRVGLPAAF